MKINRHTLSSTEQNSSSTMANFAHFSTITIRELKRHCLVLASKYGLQVRKRL